MRKIVVPCLVSISLLSCNSEQPGTENGGKPETQNSTITKSAKESSALIRKGYTGSIKSITEYQCINTKSEMTAAEIKADKQTSRIVNYYNTEGNDSVSVHYSADGSKPTVFTHDYISPLPETPNTKNVNFQYYKWLENNKLTTRRIEYVDAEFYTAIDTLSFDDQGRLVMQSQNLVTHARSGNDTTKGIIHETAYTDKDEMRYTIKSKANGTTVSDHTISIVERDEHENPIRSISKSDGGIFTHTVYEIEYTH